MSKLTKEERVRVFYYNLKRFNESMDEYQQYLQTIQMCENRKKLAEKNEMGIIKEEQKLALGKWADAIVKATIERDARMEVALEAMGNLRHAIS